MPSLENQVHSLEEFLDARVVALAGSAFYEPWCACLLHPFPKKLDLVIYALVQQ